MGITNSSQSTDVKKLLTLLSDFKSVFFVTLSNSGQLGMRPMTVIEFQDAPYIWFVTDRSSQKIQDSIDSNSVYITAQSGSEIFITAHGVPKVFEDEQTKDRLWSEPLRVWFPKGKEDPELCFVRVELTKGEYWDSSGLQKLYYFTEVIKSYVTGKTPEINKDQHAEVQIS